MFDKGAEWSHPRAGANHDHRRGIIGRQPEIFVRLHKNRHLRTGLREIGQIGRAHALTLATMRLVSHRRHREMHLAGMRERAGRNRIKPRRQLAEQAREHIGRKT